MRLASNSRRRSSTLSSVNSSRFTMTSNKNASRPKYLGQGRYTTSSTKSSDGTQYFLNPEQNMVTTAMMLHSIPEPYEPEVRVMYQILRNLVEKVTIEQAKIDQQEPIGADSYDTRTTSSWIKRAQPYQSTRTYIPLKDHLRDMHDASYILNKRHQE
jgi:hypothetical protein